MSEHLHSHHSDSDPAGKRVGVQAAIFAVLLAVVTILSHRTHTSAIMHKSTANDQWSYYQATRIKLHNSELGLNMLKVLGIKGPAEEKMVADYDKQTHKYEDQSKENMEKARSAEEAAEADEHRALRFDMGEGLLEIGLVLSSLYFIARKNMFPVLGMIAAIVGTIVGATGLML
jgi:Spy/CpxP family protein refolding chaperone